MNTIDHPDNVMNTSNSRDPFPLGQTLITAKAKAVLHPQEVLSALYCHARGESLASRHPTRCGLAFHIVTDQANRMTTVSLSGETDFSDAGLIESWVCGYGCRTCG